MLWGWRWRWQCTLLILRKIRLKRACLLVNLQLLDILPDVQL